MSLCRNFSLFGMLIWLIVISNFSIGQSLTTSSAYTVCNSVYTSNLYKTIRCDVQRLSGKVVFVWTEYDATYLREIYCAIYDKDMNILVTPFRINKSRANDQMFASVKVNQQDNSFAVTWTSYNNGSTDAEVYVKKISFDANFTNVANDDDIMVNNLTTGVQYVSDLTFDYLRNELLVCFRDNNGYDGSGLGAYFRRLNYQDNILTTSSLIGNQILMNQYTVGTQVPNFIEISPITGELITVCQGRLATGTGNEVIKRVWAFSNNNWVGGTESCVNINTTSDQNATSLVINPLTGDYIIGWTDALYPSDGYAACAKAFDKNHNVIKSDFRINATIPDNQLGPKAIWDETTNIITFFFLHADATNSNLKYRLIDASNGFNSIGTTDLDVVSPLENLQNNWTTWFFPVYNNLNHTIYLPYDLWQNSSTSIGKVRKFEYLNPIFKTPSYAKLKDELDGSYYLTIDNNLNFIYDEKYNSGILNYKIYDYRRSTTTLIPLPVITKEIGSNLITLNIKPLLNKPVRRDMSDAFYVLEVINEKGDKLKIRFKYEPTN